MAHGLAVLAAIEAESYDVILMDLEMPELDGCEATRRLRAYPGASPDRPWIIAPTASAMPYDRERTTAAGMNDFLTKPVRSDTLAQALVRAYGTLATATPAGTEAATSSV